MRTGREQVSTARYADSYLGVLEQEHHGRRAAAVEALERRRHALFADVAIDRRAFAPPDRQRQLPAERAALGVELGRQQLLHLLPQSLYLQG
eukprot:1452811-Rhodomonas_salina.4